MAEIGRNDPCPCGSGRKFKACCLHGRDSCQCCGKEFPSLQLCAVGGMRFNGKLPVVCRACLTTPEEVHEQDFYRTLEMFDNEVNADDQI